MNRTHCIYVEKSESAECRKRTIPSPLLRMIPKCITQPYDPLHTIILTRSLFNSWALLETLSLHWWWLKQLLTWTSPKKKQRKKRQWWVCKDYYMQARPWDIETVKLPPISYASYLSRTGHAMQCHICNSFILHFVLPITMCCPCLPIPTCLMPWNTNSYPPQH